MDDVKIHTGTLVADLRLPGARSIKDRRQALRSVVQRLHNRRLAVAQVGPGRAVAAGVPGCSARWPARPAGLDGMLDEAERVIFASDFEVADLRRDVHQDGFASAESTPDERTMNGDGQEGGRLRLATAAYRAADGRWRPPRAEGLARVLAKAGYGARARAADMGRAGRVTVDGNPW